jgi:hypothetical protein
VLKIKRIKGIGYNLKKSYNGMTQATLRKKCKNRVFLFPPSSNTLTRTLQRPPSVFQIADDSGLFFRTRRFTSKSLFYSTFFSGKTAMLLRTLQNDKWHKKGIVLNVFFFAVHNKSGQNVFLQSPYFALSYCFPFAFAGTQLRASPGNKNVPLFLREAFLKYGLSWIFPSGLKRFENVVVIFLCSRPRFLSYLAICQWLWPGQITRKDLFDCRDFSN